MSMSTTPALYVTRLVGAKTRFCPFCGNRFCGVFRPKRACVGCGGAMCDGCSSKMEATQGNQPLRVCPGCDARLKASPNFVDHIFARRERGEGFYRPVAAASSQTSPPPASPSSSSSSAVSSASTSSSPALAFSSTATQTLPCRLVSPSPFTAAPTSALGGIGYTINMMMMPPYTAEPRPSASPIAWLLRAIGNTANDDSNTNTTNPDDNSSNNTSSSSIGTISSGSNNGAHQQGETFASRMDQGEAFLRQKATTIAQGVLRKRYGMMGVAAVVVGVSGFAAFVGRSRSRR